MTNIYWSKEQIEKAYNDFRVFAYMVWLTIGLPAPTKLQYDIADTLQNPPSDRYIIQGFRGIAKSFLTCAYAVWCLWRNPNCKVMIVSAGKDRADANAVFIRKIILSMDFLSHLAPQQGQRNTQNLFDVGTSVPDISPSVKSVGIFGQLTGSRADILIADDVEVPNNSATQLMRDKLQEAIKEFDAILKPNGTIIYLGTPQNEMSIYNELQKRGYLTRIWTVLYPRNPKEADYYGERLAPVIREQWESDPEKWSGQPTEPSRFPLEEIMKRMLSYGKAGFQLQFMLNTDLSDAEKYPLKLSDLIVDDLDMNSSSLKWAWASGVLQRLSELPCVGLRGDMYFSPLSRSTEVLDYTGSIMAIDPSGRGKDETTYAIVKYLNGYLFLLAVGGYRDGYSDATLGNLAMKAKMYNVNQVVFEGNFGDGMFGKLFSPVLRKIHPCAIEEVKNYSQKEARIIDVLEPVMMRHKLIVNKQVIVDDFKVYEQDFHRSLFYQMTRICKEKGALAHDDRLDALAIAVAYWVEMMDRDEEDGMEELLEEQLEMWLDPDYGVASVLNGEGCTDASPKGRSKRTNCLKRHFGLD